jgi:hypothetical protein
MGRIDFENATIEKNNVRYALIDMIRELEVGSKEKADLKEEVDAYLQQQAPAVSNRINVTGNENINIQGSSGNQINIPKK